MKLDFISKVVILLMILCIAVAFFYFYQNRIQECTSNPLVFSAKLYEENYNVKAIGHLTLLSLNDSTIKPINLWFNSNNFTVEK